MKNINNEQDKKTNINPEYFSTCFHKMREEKDLTQGELAECLGISRQSVNAIEKGKSLPSIDLALNIADFFQKSLDEFFRIEEEIERDISNIRKETNMSNLTPFDQFKDTLTLREAMDRLLEDSVVAGEALPVLKSGGGLPSVDMYDDGKNIVAEVHLPGYDEKDVDVEVDDEAIYISGKREEKKEDKKKNYYRKEVMYGKFSRTLAFPTAVKSSQAKAEFSDGILKVVTPKEKEKKAKTLKVEVRKKK